MVFYGHRPLSVLLLFLSCCASYVFQVRTAAAQTLGAWGEAASGACDALAQCVIDNHVPRNVAAVALAQIGAVGAGALREMVSSNLLGTAVRCRVVSEWHVTT